jgi:hypothetical protein
MQVWMAFFASIHLSLMAKNLGGLNAYLSSFSASL